MTYIYLIENCYGNPNKVYIGKCTHPLTRKSQHIKKFGKASIFTVIDYVSSKSKYDWKPLESFWIEQFKCWGFDLENKNNGGGGPSFRSPEFIERLRTNRLGKKASDITKQKMSISNSKPKPEGFGDKLKKPNSKPWVGKPVCQCDINGNVIKIWPSARIASITLGINMGSISSVISGKRGYKLAGGFKWKRI